MQATAVFPQAPVGAGMYESFYLRAVAPHEPVGVWIRYTVHKRAGEPPLGSLWCTAFDAARGAPFMHKVTAPAPSARSGAWIEIGGASTFGADGAEGSCGPARWSLRFGGGAAELRHLRPELLYRAPVPRTKLTTPSPLVRIDGRVELPGRAPLELSAWPGMIGHNWGREHAERWIWLHGCGFEEDPDAWLDLAAGRILVAGRLTPWVVNGAISSGGTRRRLGGLIGRRPEVDESPRGCELTVAGAGGTRVGIHVEVPGGAAAGWRYADPDGGEHDVVNCSISALRVTVHDAGATPRQLTSAHGGAYELGMRERDHGVPLAPFADG
jgi:hypothetical protein